MPLAADSKAAEVKDEEAATGQRGVRLTTLNEVVTSLVTVTMATFCRPGVEDDGRLITDGRFMGDWI